MNRRQLYDKVLGMLLGSAIGDAMGAPTEMWTRQEIRTEYGYVDRLDTMVREPSPEGTWDYNLPAGGTTDDTRWKKFMVGFLLGQKKGLTRGGLDAREFADYFVGQYTNEIRQLKATDGFEPGPYEAGIRRMAWLQEWALVAKPYAAGDLQAYHDALNRFYGGEMTCAGMLYAPVVGAFFPADPARAYRETFRLSLFDIGYARDISGLTAAMVSAAMAGNATPESVLNVVRDVDPHGFFRSRLVGRSAYRVLKQARAIVLEANQLQKGDVNPAKITFPKRGRADTLYLARAQRAYELLDARNQDLPFHAAEIHLVNLTALLLGGFDFEKTMAFIINYGRDNDTTGAVTGAILGAYWGANRLPKPMVAQVIKANRALFGTELEALAEQMTEKIMARHPRE
ncbi:MAG: ADP-ribosylglycohydrolase family protein [Ferruginibacter sp.]|nr:ADP-ribosylglycohydrolase family protein [Cytophagales bacterium]